MNLELIIVILSAAFLIFLYASSKVFNRINFILVSVLLVLSVLHLFLQGPRWQMYVEYAFIIYFFITVSVSFRGKPSGKRLNRFLFIFWLVLLLSTAGLLVIFQYNQMPEIEGDYNVGTMSFDAVDTERIEIYGDTPGNPRKIRLQFWYPAGSVDGAEKDFWLSDGPAVARMLPAFAGMPGFMMEYTSRIKSNSYKDVPILRPEYGYPVVILSHGWLGFRNLHSDLGELLAANGFIAVSIDHSYGALATVFDDGTTAQLDPDALPPGDDDGFPAAANKLVKTYSFDAMLVLDLLNQLNDGTAENTTIKDSGFFMNCMDLNSVGAAGHSTGGGGVTRLAITDSRVSAVFGFDPWVEPVEPEILQRGLAVPSVFLRSGQWADGKNNKYLQMIKDSPDTLTAMYQLNGTNHQDFSMMYMFDPVSKLMGFSGSLDSFRGGEIQRDLVLRFFNSSLKGPGAGYSDFADAYPELVDIYWQ